MPHSYYPKDTFSHSQTLLKSKLGYEKSFEWRQETEGNRWQYFIFTITTQTNRKEWNPCWYI